MEILSFNIRRALSAVAVTSVILTMAIGTAMVSAETENLPEAGPGVNPAVTWIIANVSAQRIYHLLYDLQNFSTRYVSTPNLNASAQYIFEDYSNSSQLIVQSQYFMYNTYMLRNIIAVLPAFNPANKTMYVIGGHYDSWVQPPGNPMVWAPGVDDDASGTVAAMEVARVLSPYRFNATIAFAAWTAEEVGLVGSNYHASSLRAAGQEVGAAIAMDMIGNYAGTMGLDLVYDLPTSMGGSEWIANALIQANTEYGLGLTVAKFQSGAGNSDHASFWANNYHAIMAAEADFSPNWHRDTDTIDNVNITLITRATQLAAAALAEMAGIIPPGVGAVTFDKNAYKPGDNPLITLYDSDMNVNSGVIDTAPVMVFSDSEPAGEVVILAETGSNTSIFTGTIELVAGLPVAGKLEVKDSDTIRVEYVDADPPGVRTDTARIDAILPVISGVFAVPDIDSATIHWQTNEPADSMVLYGETPALGLSTYKMGLTLDHSVQLTGLTSGTLYYYDVQSSDEAGNTAVSDNGGSHYTFMTLHGFVVRTEIGYVGYVKSNEPALNYFTGPEILSGLGFQGTYRGAAQLNTSTVSIPPGATILKATLELFAEDWEYEDSGSWTLRLLNSSIDANWVSSGYTLINGASTDAVIPPTLTYNDLAPGEWDIFSFTPSQFDILRNRIGTGKISFRLDGPPSPPRVVLFKWFTGNDDPTIAPRLRVAYSLTGDTEGPLVTELSASPNPTMSSQSTDVQVTISDESTGGGNVTYAEYFWGPDPGMGKATPILASDGGYDSPVESTSMTLDLTSVPVGIYALGFRGRDQSGNWGPVSTLTLYVGVWDLFPPSVDSLTFAPPMPESATPVNISAVVTDDIGVSSVWAEIRDPSGTPLGNFSMRLDSIFGRYYYMPTYGPLGTYQVTVRANDTSDKWNSTAGSFEVVDTTDPMIIQKSAVPSPQNYGMTVTFTAWVVDRFLDIVKVAFFDPIGIPAGNYTATRNGPMDNNYSFMMSFPTLGQWTYCFYAIDTTGNEAFSCSSFEIVDGYPPTFISVAATPPIQGYGQTVTVTAWVKDPYIDSAWLNVTGPDQVWLGNYSMTRTIPWEDNWTYSRSYGAIGQHDYTVWAYDASGNHAHSSSAFFMVDRTPPVFDNVQALPDPAEFKEWVKISARVSDIQSVSIDAEVRDPAGTSLGNVSMQFNATSSAFERDEQGLALGTYSYSLWATDASNNHAKWTGTFQVRDTIRPMIQLVSILGVRAENSNETTVAVLVSDNYAVDANTVSIEWVAPGGPSIGNWTMNPAGPSGFSYARQLTAAGLNNFIVTARDTSGNLAVLTGEWMVIVGEPPVAVAGDDRNVTAGDRIDLDGSASSDDFGIVRYVWRITGPDVDETREGAEANFTFDSPGSYTVTLTVYDSADRSHSDSFTVTVSTADVPDDNQMFLDPIVLMTVALIVIILIALLLLLLAKRRRTSESEEGKEGDEGPSKKQD